MLIIVAIIFKPISGFKIWVGETHRRILTMVVSNTSEDKNAQYSMHKMSFQQNPLLLVAFKQNSNSRIPR